MTIIVCPTCSTRYRIDETRLATATQFVCRKCQTRSPIHTHLEQPQQRPPLSPPPQQPPLPSADSDDFALAEKMLAALEASDIDVIFKTEGTALDLSGNNPLLLDTREFVWLVTAGAVDMFSVRVEHGLPAGARHHILRVETGHLLLGLEAERHGYDWTVIAVGTPGTSVLQLDRNRFQRLVQAHEFSAIGIASLLEQWVSVLTLAFKTEMIPKECRTLELSESVKLPKHTNYKPSKGILWVRHLKGTSTFMGNPHFPEIGETVYFPVHAKSWLTTSSSAILEARELSALINEDAFWDYLERFHQLIVECLEIQAKHQHAAERTRFAQQAANEQIFLGNALAHFIAVITRKRGQIEESDDRLLTACRAIGTYLNMTFTPHPDAHKGRNSLEDIVKASRIRTRGVMLKDTWWREDNGPLLAYTVEGKRPVALLPMSARRYVLFDPEHHTRVKVTARVAETLEALAYTFYAPFPDHELSAFDLVRIGFHGTFEDTFMVLLMGVLGALLGLATPLLTGLLFDAVIPGAELSQLYQIGIILAACAVARLTFNVTKSFATLRIEGRSDYRVQAALWDRLLSLPTTFFTQYSAGDLAVRSMGISAIRKTLSGVTISTILSAIFSIGYWALLFYYDRHLAIAATIISFVIMLISVASGLITLHFAKPLHAIQGKISGIVLQLITGISKLRITGTEDYAFAVWAREFSEQRRLTFELRMVGNMLGTFTSVVPIVASGVLYYLIIRQITQDELGLTTGKFLAFFAAYGSFQGSLIEVGSALLSILKIVPMYRRLEPIITTLPEVDPTQSYPGDLTGDIELTQISFRYKEDGPLVLHEVNLHIHSGDFIAIVGSSGSGKSTIMRLLLGFETPESGSIFYDNKDMTGLDITEIRRQIGVVLQNSQIMAGSIYHNIAGGSATLTIRDAWEAARMAGCEEDIRAMPMGMHTVLPPGGGTLSGGQRQRILIARAIVRKPRILFFDEATSALDNRTQQIVSESIAQLQATRIVIAHRLSTIMRADKIYVLEKGRIVEQGTYADLMKRNGLFAELARRQLA